MLYKLFKSINTVPITLKLFWLVLIFLAIVILQLYHLIS